MKPSSLSVVLILIMLVSISACSRIDHRQNSNPGSPVAPTLVSNGTGQDTIDPLVNELDKLLDRLDSQLKSTDTIPESIP
jgi:hypothetical protein